MYLNISIYVYIIDIYNINIYMYLYLYQRAQRSLYGEWHTEQVIDPQSKPWKERYEGYNINTHNPNKMAGGGLVCCNQSIDENMCNYWYQYHEMKSALAGRHVILFD